MLEVAVASTGEAAAIAEPLVVVSAKLSSAPLVGDTENESPAFYDDTSVFRTGRRSR